MDSWGAPNEEKVRNALENVLAHSRGKYTEYAKTYAKAGLEMTEEELRMQVLYVLNNLLYWKGELAKQVKQALKEEYKL